MMSETNALINLIASLCITVALSLIYVELFVFGDSPLHGRSWRRTLQLKIGLALAATGAFLNVLTSSNPPTSEVVLNCGLGVLFFALWSWITQNKSKL